MATTKKGKTFWAKVSKGSLIRGISDILAASLNRVTLEICKNGLFVREHDANKTILFDINLPADGFFSGYFCKEERTVSLNIKQVQKCIKDVKKKDMMFIYIRKSRPDKISFAVSPHEGENGSETRITTNTFPIHNEEESPLKFPVPEYHRISKKEKLKVYKRPMVLNSTDYQKTKILFSLGCKDIVISQQRGNYISFETDETAVAEKNFEFGELLEHLESEEEVDESGEEEEKSESDDSEIPGYYEDIFKCTTLKKISKAPTLCTEMRFYAPTIKEPPYPLKIEFDIGSSGVMRIYIKSSALIDYEKDQELRKNQNAVKEAY